MATVRVTSELVETDGSETEEFFSEAGDLDLATSLLLQHEESVAHEDWVAWVAYNSGFYFDESGFSFTIYDDGSEVLYRYTFTA